MGDICRSFLSSCVAFSRASFESLVFLILSSISASSSFPSSSPSSFWIAFICSWRKYSRWVFSICRLTRVRMRFSTCSTEISLSIRPRSELFELVRRLLARLLRELGLLDLVLDLGELVFSLLVAELLLDRLHLLVEKILALGLLHLPLDAGADALLDLQHRNLAVDQAEIGAF